MNPVEHPHGKLFISFISSLFFPSIFLSIPLDSIIRHFHAIFIVFCTFFNSFLTKYSFILLLQVEEITNTSVTPRLLRETVRPGKRWASSRLAELDELEEVLERPRSKLEKMKSLYINFISLLC